MLKAILWIASGLVALAIARVVVAIFSGSNRMTPMPKDDPWLLQAVARAQHSFAEMRSLVDEGQNVAVKFPLRNKDGEIEHVWGAVRSASDEGLEVDLLTPLLVGPSPEGRINLSREQIEDWQSFLPAGGIRGGYTTQAQIAVCRREGLRIPKSLLNQDPHFVDRIEFPPLQPYQ